MPVSDAFARAGIQDEFMVIDRTSNDGSGRVQYIGKARPGTATSDAAWLIKKLTYGAGGEIISGMYGGREAAFTGVWDARASYTYS